MQKTDQKRKTKHRLLHTGCRRLLSLLCAGGLIFARSASALAGAPTEAEERLALQRAMEIQSNQVPNWPAGPTVGAESAILMEAETGAILYAKNIHQKQYPASTTKILSTLIAAERCSMDEIVPITQEAVSDTPRDSNHIALDAGEALTMEQCLSAILIRSANEAAFSLAAYIADGSWRDFAQIMNDRAKELGCLNSHFVNPNGLPDENHYTTAYDLAQIGRAFFANELLCKITLTKRLDIPPSDLQPDHIIENNSMQIIPGGEYAYEGLVGCKTGYTNAARSCLVSAAERDGMRLVCVVMHDEAPYQYKDTIALFDYGFNNFEKVNVSQTDSKYNITDTGPFYSGRDIFGSSDPILSLDRDDYVVLPRTASFEELESAVSYDTADEGQAAVINYSYHGVPLGSVRVNFSAPQTQDSVSSPAGSGGADEQETAPRPVIYINVVRVLLGMAAVAVLLFVGFLARAFLKNYQFSRPNSRRAWRRSNRQRRRNASRSNKFKDFDF